jgi:VIT1/CCC1 family predicted Fe2+/Mn2+ transporter
LLNTHREFHRFDRIGWLRAGVLGANDGIVSTASLIIGVAAAKASHQEILISGLAALVAGAMSMAAGEYVSVSSQADTERADLAREKDELENNIAHERDELTQIYIDRGLDPKLAREVSKQLMDHDALGSHARDELGISTVFSARPIQAAVASAIMFASGAVIPVLIVFFPSADTHLILTVSIVSLVSLGLLGASAAYAGGASTLKGSLRVVFWGALAMAVTAGVGAFFGTTVS